MNKSMKRSRVRNGTPYKSMLVGNSGYGTTSVSGGLLSADSTYYYRTFKTSGSLVVSGGSITADILVVAGGGGAGAGGGGAGGLQGFTSQTLAAGTHTVTIGSGGAADAAGSNSVLGSLAASVGGGGGKGTADARNNGGSGGGGREGSTAGGTGIAGQGYAGGIGASDGVSWAAGGGGGGATAVGAAATGAYPENSYGGNGGAGSSAYSSWGLATGTGHNVSGTVYYAGGGAGTGGGGANGNGGTGGNGGGGQGGASGTKARNSTAGTANTGGGGGGGGTTPSAGGSGIVIVRYLKSTVLPNQTDFELIGTITLSASQSSVTFTGLPSEYKHLQLRAATRSDLAGTVQDVYLRFNGDATASNYYYHGLYGTGSAVGSESSQSPTGARFMQSPGTSAASGLFYTAICDILDPFSTTKNKTIRTFSGSADSNNWRNWLVSNSWFSTAAVTSITLVTNNGSNFVSGTRFSIYGARG